MKIDTLSPEEWPRIARFVTDDPPDGFGNKMPTDPLRAAFVVARDSDQIAGFLHVEYLYHFVCVKVMPGYENQGIAVDLIQAGVEAAKNFPAIWLADRDGKDDLRSLARLMGARDNGLYRYYRRDGGQNGERPQSR